MKTIMTILFLFIAQLTFAQPPSNRVTDQSGNEQLLGELTTDDLSMSPFKKWYNKGFKKYNPDPTALADLKNLEDYEIEVFMGTWCGDSRREVPQLMKTLNELNYPMNQVSIYGVNRTKEQYKKSPNGEEVGKNIHRVPTIILYKEGKEVDRIVESTLGPIESDIQTIISGGAYDANYAGVDRLEELINKQSIEYVIKNKESIADELRDITYTSSELNTYGYLQMYDFSYEKAVAIFEVNTQLFSDEADVYDSLAEAYFELGNFDKAQHNYLKVIELDSENEHALQMLGKIVVERSK